MGRSRVFGRAGNTHPSTYVAPIQLCLQTSNSSILLLKSDRIVSAVRSARLNIVLISTYELGRQPFGLSSPAAWLRARGHHVSCFDLSREPLGESAISAAQLVAFYVPMHTATRLAAELIVPVRRLNPRVPLCFYGLYAPVNEGYLRDLGVGTILGGEFEEGIASLAARLQEAAGEDGSPTVQQEPVISSRSTKIPDARQGRDAGFDELCPRYDAQRRAEDCRLDRSHARLQASLPALPDRAGV